MNDLEERVAGLFQRRADTAVVVRDVESVVDDAGREPAAGRRRQGLMVATLAAAAVVGLVLLADRPTSDMRPAIEPTPSAPTTETDAVQPVWSQGDLADDDYRRLVVSTQALVESDEKWYDWWDARSPGATLVATSPGSGFRLVAIQGRGGGSYTAWRTADRGVIWRNGLPFSSGDVLVQPETLGATMFIIDTFGERVISVDEALAETWHLESDVRGGVFLGGNLVVLRAGATPALVVNPTLSSRRRVIELAEDGACDLASLDPTHLAVLVGEVVDGWCVGDEVAVVDVDGRVVQRTTLPADVRALDGNGQGLLVGVGSKGQLVGGTVDETGATWSILVGGGVDAAFLP